MEVASPCDEPRGVHWLLLGILALALLLRLPGHFYPVTFHYDEGAEIRTALSYASGTLYPDNLVHPALNTYLIFVAEAAYYIGGRAVRKFDSAVDFLQAYETDLRGFLYVGRTVPLLAALCTVFLTYHLGRRVWNVPIGLAGALLLAVSPLHIIVSNNLRLWSLGTCFTTLALLFLVRLGPAAERRVVAVAGIVIGFAIASIYILGLLLLPLAVALGIRWRGMTVAGTRLAWGKDVATAIAGVAIGFTVGNFGVLLAWRHVLDTLAQYLARDWTSSSSAYLTNVGSYVASLWDVVTMGPLLASLAVAAMLWASWRASTTQWIVLSFVWSVFLVQPAVLYLWANRYTAIVYPMLLLVVSALVTHAWVRVTAVWPRLGRLPFRALALFLLVAPNLVTMVGYCAILQRTPTRELARQWVEAHIPSGTKLILTLKYMNPLLPLGRASLEKKYGKYSYKGLAPHASGPHYEVVYLQPHHIETANKAAILQNRLAELADEGFSYVIYTDATPPIQKSRRRRKDVLDDMLQAKYPLVSRFVYPDLTRLPDETATVNPEVRIYRLRRD
jgi:hypothetical protein